MSFFLSFHLFSPCLALPFLALPLALVQIRELLSFYKFDGDDIPLVAGSALAAVEGRDKEVGEDAIMELMEAVDSHIPTPTRGVCVL